MFQSWGIIPYKTPHKPAHPHAEPHLTNEGFKLRLLLCTSTGGALVRREPGAIPKFENSRYHRRRLHTRPSPHTNAHGKEYLRSSSPV